jgi:hypothetical protein
MLKIQISKKNQSVYPQRPFLKHRHVFFENKDIIHNKTKFNALKNMQIYFFIFLLIQDTGTTIVFIKIKKKDLLSKATT